MTTFIRRGSTFTVSKKENLDTSDLLPAATYSVEFNERENYFFLEKITNFEIGHKLYGNVAERSTRILNTFQMRQKQTGCLLAGEKGSGKSLLAKKISIDARALGIPTIIVGKSYCGDLFNNFLQMIRQPCIVIFDEFEKTYHEKESKEAILTLFDGTYPSNKLYVMTVNDEYAINDHMKNRPGRVFYAITFNGVDKEFVREYCEEKLDNKDHIEEVCQCHQMFNNWNFDMLAAIVEEMNRYQETCKQVLTLLNVKPLHDKSITYKVSITSKKVIEDSVSKFVTMNPFDSDNDYAIYYDLIVPEGQQTRLFLEKVKDLSAGWEGIEFYEGSRDKKEVIRITNYLNRENIVKNSGKEILYKDPFGSEIKLERVNQKTFNWLAV